jgi:hypothetical protein
MLLNCANPWRSSPSLQVRVCATGPAALRSR